MKSPSAFGTRIPAANVWGSGQASDSGRPSMNALTIGAHPVDWTATKRGSFAPNQPIARSSANAFHMPMRPTPPPVG